MNATQHIVLASSQEQHYSTGAAAAAARTKTPPARPVKPGRRSTSTSTSHPPPKHQQQQQQHALPFDRLSLQNTAPLMMPIEGCEKLFPQPRGGRNLCFVTEDEEEDYGNVKLEEDLKRLTRVSLFKSTSRSTSPPHPRKQQQTTTSRTELQDETESTESTTESAYEDSDHDNSTTNAKDDAALESLWQTAQQSKDEQQKLQVYWNLCYPQGTATTSSATTTSATNCTPTKTRSLLSSQSQEPTKSWYVRSFVRFIIVYFLLCIVHYVLCIVGCSLISNTLHCSHCYSTFEL